MFFRDYFVTMETTLRIIRDTSRSAAFNMAADLYLLSRCVSEPVVYLRFYTWHMPTITIGYMQNAAECLAMDLLVEQGVSWIRRPTGGRAVLHHQDITYSCVFSKERVAMGGGIAETYHLISECLMQGLQLSGINCSSHSFFVNAHAVKREIKLPCFLAPNRSEVMFKGKKLIGSAQKRTAEAVLQHGSIPLTGTFRELPRYQNISEEQQRVFVKLLHRKCTCIDECVPAWNETVLVENLQKGFSRMLPFTAVVKGWREDEVNDIEKTAGSEEFQNSWMR
jgi:lipoate-protein ligase A